MVLTSRTCAREGARRPPPPLRRRRRPEATAQRRAPSPGTEGISGRRHRSPNAMTGSRATEENRDRDTGNEKRAIQMRAKIERRGRRVKGTKQEQERKKGTSEQRTNGRERKETRKKTDKVDEKPRRKQDETRDKRSTERTKTQKAEHRPGEDTTQRERERVYSRRHHGVIQALASMLLGPRSSVSVGSVVVLVVFGLRKETSVGKGIAATNINGGSSSETERASSIGEDNEFNRVMTPRSLRCPAAAVSLTTSPGLGQGYCPSSRSSEVFSTLRG